MTLGDDPWRYEIQFSMILLNLRGKSASSHEISPPRHKIYKSCYTNMTHTYNMTHLVESNFSCDIYRTLPSYSYEKPFFEKPLIHGENICKNI
jgi:hypothetical protein